MLRVSIMIILLYPYMNKKKTFATRDVGNSRDIR